MTFLIKYGTEWIIKQPERAKLDVVNEALSAHLAHSLQIPTQQVEIIPANAMTAVKKYPKMPATLHSFVPGRIVRMSPYKKVDIKQYKNRGLTRETIQHMSKHPDFPRIVALDTFIGMDDRSGSNYFYDEETDTFWLIDMADSFRVNLSKIACEQIQKIGTDVSMEERRALELYQETLRLLVKKYPPEKLNALFEMYLKQTHYAFPEKAIQRQKEWFLENEADCRRLILLVDEIIATKT